ncbi:FecR family protein [Gimesia fumaroli]|uniref:FecR protein n=1 Tax=Gimesia fumaroli TaxID=2527976 RepID=A0A518IDN5_9PLAN|nr:FecR domain-containing protein [Gimesia fumaroli]QDV51189.1 FecR protein [Gimesia fumaroli]
MPDEDQQNEAEFERLMHRLADGSLEKAEVEHLESLLLDQPERQTLYLEYMLLDSSLIELGEVSKTAPELTFGHPRRKHLVPFSIWALATCALLCLIAVAIFVSAGRDQQKHLAELKTTRSESSVLQSTERNTAQDTLSDARIVAGHRAVFRGMHSPTSIGNRLTFSENYMLQDGLVKIRFVSGAEVILSAPALFQVVHNEKLVVNLGKCSVYAPEGAEGFEVSTPTSDVIDLGTRFSVVVAEDGASKVAVVDGEAEVSSLSKPGKRTLLKGDTAYVGTDLHLMEGSQDTQSDDYVASIPDRLISYKTNQDILGRAVDLSSLSVQRAGIDHSYHADDFILPRVNHYRPGSNAFGIVPAHAPADEHNQFGLMNLKFASGFINPGGQNNLHEGGFILGRDGTPGMNLVFDQPVINSPGPDLVIFDAQSIAHSLEGDVFRLYPRSDHSDARPMTIRKYDIDGHSEDAQIMTGCRLTQLSTNYANDGTPLPIVARSQLVHQVPSRLFAIGIDLDDMKIPPGGSITGLFLQDAQDDADRIDPVVIVGLPPIQ